MVSVILPTHNRAELLKRAIAGVLAQTYSSLELIVVDDASGDHTQQVLAAIRDPRLRVIHRKQSRGAAAARNAGIEAAAGDYIAFQDDDDIWLLQKLEKQVRALQNSRQALWCLCCHVRLEKYAARYIGGAQFIQQLDYAEGAGIRKPDWSLIATPGWLVSRGALDAAGNFDERIRSFDDWELGLRLFQLGRPVILDEPLWLQDRWSGSGLIRQKRSRALDLRIIMEKHGAIWAHRPDVRARHWRISGRILSLEEPVPSGRDELVKSLRAKPFAAETWLALLAASLGREWNRKFTRAIRRVRNAL